MSARLVDFLLGVKGLPAFLCEKTLFSHRKAGLGMGYLPTLQPTRVLDNLHRCPQQLRELWAQQQSPSPMHPVSLFQSAAEGFRASTLRKVQPVQTTLAQYAAMPGNLETFTDQSWKSKLRGVPTP